MARRGFVLAAVLFAVVLLSVLAAAGFFAAFQETRAGRNAQGSVRAREAAQAALWRTLTGWDPLVLNALAPGASLATSPTATPGITVSVRTRRLDERLFLVRARAQEANGAEQELGVVLRLLAPETAPAAVRARHVDPSLSALGSGIDAAPAGWSCSAPSDTVPAILAQPGAPDSVLFQFAPMDWAGVRAWAGSATSGGDSIELRYEPGDLTLSAGRTLGVLVVGGDLTLHNRAEVVGLILVRGTVRLDGAGGTIIGALVASQVVAVNGYSSAAPAVRYSSCAVLVASLRRALPVPLEVRPPVAFF